MSENRKLNTAMRKFFFLHLKFVYRTLLQIYIKIAPGTKISFSIFLHFRVEYDLLTHATKFQSFKLIGSILFFKLLFEISRLTLLGFVPEVNKAAWLKLQKVASLAQHEKFHMANFHMDSAS